MTSNSSQTSAQDYYPFGSLEPGRTYSSENYRFGFNGQEMDNEISGLTGTHTTAEFWEYDSRLGRRWNRDPITYTNHSSYLCFNGNPIKFADPLGLEGDPPSGGSSAGSAAAAKLKTLKTLPTVDIYGDRIYLPQKQKWYEKAWSAVTQIAEISRVFGEGFLNALSSDNTLGFNRQNPYERNDLTYTKQDIYATGQKVGDAVALLGGLVEMVGGCTGELVGIVTTPIGVGVPVQAVSITVITHSASVIVVSAKNLFSKVERTSDNAHGNPDAESQSLNNNAGKKFKGGTKKERDGNYLYTKERDFVKWFHRYYEDPSAPNVSNKEIDEAYKEWIRRGKPNVK
ncbi:MAG: hypothetical protein A2W93_03070 [Bacteroidetes bacterium GWF2_43_63]|nr:MAG: hypothetical protein A2W94_09070 [Bacteroidetes bacterium GWE2_42_42]OFY53645.1 MAG: hypothetical protein A2W93_03070 [Bacteroidetes bacterium GWF2_43_63]HBG71014.1 hypothetical protein [Bacteroidales bacterium]HCB63592.1 hypothetical protein [Bacteroidales bacterium]HCY24341.1 hypothetical protein [Bacteroidales bacterium]